MGQAPWFKFFAADYMSSPFVQALDPEQELWYLRLIIASAIGLPRGCLPLANGKLWRIAKAPSEKHFAEHAPAILAKFQRDDAAGVYRVPKVADQQLLTPDGLSAKRSEAGKRGAAKRWQVATPTDGKLPSGPMAKVRQNIADSDSDSDVSTSSSEPKTGSDQMSGVPSKRTSITPSREACRLAALLKSEILRNKADYRITPAQERKWAVTADRMLRLDGRGYQASAGLITWAQHDEFWLKNVLSMDTLRSKYDELQMRREHPNSNGHASRKPTAITGSVLENHRRLLKEADIPS